MAEELAKSTQYDYRANANLVLTSDRSDIVRRETDTPDIQSLYGKIDPREFGSKVRREQPPAKSAIANASTNKSAAKMPGEKKTLASALSFSVDDSFDGLAYRPRTRETQGAYEMCLALVSHRYMAEQSSSVVRSVADEAILILKDGSTRDVDKKGLLEGLFSVDGQATLVTSDDYARLISLVKRLTDYGTNISANTATLSSAAGSLERSGDEAFGVTVVIDEDEIGQEGLAPLDSIQYTLGDDQEEDENTEDKEETADLNDFTYQNALLSSSSHENKSYSVDVRDVDAFWIQRNLSVYYKDAYDSYGKAQDTWAILETCTHPVDLENKLVQLLGFDKFDLIKTILRNTKEILYGVRLAKAVDAPDDRLAVIGEMKSDPEAAHLIALLETPDPNNSQQYSLPPGGSVPVVSDNSHTKKQENDPDAPSSLVPSYASGPPIDIASLAFAQGSHTMTNKCCKLPENSWKKAHVGYEEIHIPAPSSDAFPIDEPLTPVQDLPPWTHPAFPSSMKTLNRLQSKVAPAALLSDDPLLVCAPTGSGKTNVALLAILRVLMQHGIQKSPSDADFSSALKRGTFKIVYVAPMKALVQEMVATFSQRLSPYGVVVGELTGDHSLTKEELASSDMLVTTPEKWDVITRKGGERSFTRLIRLMVVDEIHLLHDTRGPVLEAVISRARRQSTLFQDPLRIVALSATLPNAQDVAYWLGVPKSGLFVFDSRWRPTPLSQTFFGFTERKPHKRLASMNTVVYEQVVQKISSGQILIFVHSRKETAKSARFIRDTATTKEELGIFLQQSGGQESFHSKDALEAASISAANLDLKELLPVGFAIHHAGLSREDRHLVEGLFVDGLISVMVSTSTLAWGVNLPAHTVIIKGTQVYSPDKGSWTELSPQDVLQMFGRAGRPQYDTYGEAILLTGHSELSFYLSLSNAQLPIESQMMSSLADHLNAEAVLGNVRSIDDAVQWMSSLYLYVRMRLSPHSYGIQTDEMEGGRAMGGRVEEDLASFMASLAYSAAVALEKGHLIQYDRRVGKISPSELGRIASHFYLNYKTMNVITSSLTPLITSELDLLRIFASCSEFSLVRVRDDEKVELERLLDTVPIPIKEDSSDSLAKINVLLQAMISGVPIDGMALAADMIYISQSAVRILRALLEVALAKGYPRIARMLLDLARSAQGRTWKSHNPLRQLKHIGKTVSLGDGRPSLPVVSHVLTPDIINRLERREVSFEMMRHLTSDELGEWVKKSRLGYPLKCLIDSLPRCELVASVTPLSSSLISISLTLTPDFVWDDGIHGRGPEPFWVIVEDADEERLLYYHRLLIKRSWVKLRSSNTQSSSGASTDACGGRILHMSFVVELTVPVPPSLYVSVLSDRYHHGDVRVPINFRSLVVPERTLIWTDVLDLAPILLNLATQKKSGKAEKEGKDGLKHGTVHADDDDFSAGNGLVVSGRPLSSMRWPFSVLSSLWKECICMNPIQTQLFRFFFPALPAVAHEEDNVRGADGGEDADTNENGIHSDGSGGPFVAGRHCIVTAPHGAGKTMLADMAILSFWKRCADAGQPRGKTVILSPHQDRLSLWINRYQKQSGKLDSCALDGDHRRSADSCSVGMLRGEDVSFDLHVLTTCDIVGCTPRVFEWLSRRWINRAVFKAIGLVIIRDWTSMTTSATTAMASFSHRDEAVALENAVSRLLRLQGPTAGLSGLTSPGGVYITNCQLLFLSTPMVSIKSVSEWIGVRSMSEQVFQFERVLGHGQSPSIIVEHVHVPMGSEALVNASIHTLYSILTNNPNKNSDKRNGGADREETFSSPVPAMIFVPTSRVAVQLAADLVTLAVSKDTPTVFSPLDHDQSKSDDEDDQQSAGSPSPSSRPCHRRALSELEDFIERWSHMGGALVEFLGTNMAFIIAGIGIWSEDLAIHEKMILEFLFTHRFISLLVIPKACIWQVSNIYCSLSVIMSTSGFAGREGGLEVEDPIYVLQAAVGRAILPHSLDGSSDRSRSGCVGGHLVNPRAVVMTGNRSLVSWYQSAGALIGPVHVESALEGVALASSLLSDIASGTTTLSTRQDCVDWMTWSFLYRRLSANPNYYHLVGRSHRHLSEGLSEMVETALEDLASSKMILLDADRNKEGEREPNSVGDGNGAADARDLDLAGDGGGEIALENFGIIANYYGLSYDTVHMIVQSMKSSTKIKGILEILAAALVMEDPSFALLKGEWRAVERLSTKELPIKTQSSLSGDADFVNYQTRLRCKAHSLLQCHFSGKKLPGHLLIDMEKLVASAPRILHAIVDVASSQAFLTPALAAMDVCQMVRQGLWDADSPLKQIPIFRDHEEKEQERNRDMLALLNACLSDAHEDGINSIYDLM